MAERAAVNPDCADGSASWVAVDRETGRAVLETWSPAVRDAVNLERYQVRTAAEHLATVNREIRAAAMRDPLEPDRSINS